MRIFPLVLGFSMGAFLMWKVMPPIPVMLSPCEAGRNCAVAGTVPLAAAPRPGLRIVLYDPLIDPRPEIDTPYPPISEWSPTEPPPIRDASQRADSPIASDTPRLQILGLGQSGAHGACAAVNGKRLYCVALLDPVAE